MCHPCHLLPSRHFLRRSMAINLYIHRLTRKTSNSSVLQWRIFLQNSLYRSGTSWTLMQYLQNMSFNSPQKPCELYHLVTIQLPAECTVIFMIMICRIEDQEAFQQWISVHDLLSKTIRKSARVALGKDPAKVQKYTMSGRISIVF